MKTASGTVARTCELMASLLRGAVHDRHTVAKALGVTVAAGDRYIRALTTIPGVTLTKQRRRLTLRFLFGEAMRDAGV